MTTRRLLADVLAFGLLAGAYFGAGKLGLSLAIANASASAVWPPAGIALAAVLLLGYRVWPAVFLGAYLVNVTTSGSAATSLGIATGNTLEALLGAFLLRRYANGRDAFERPQDACRFVLLVATASTTVGATLGVTSLCLGGLASGAECPELWLTWWLGDAAGALIVAPVIVLWAREKHPRWSGRRLGEAALLGAAVVLAGLLVFEDLLPLGGHSRALAFVCTPLVVWGATRFSPRDAASVTLLLAVIAVRGTLRGEGPFASDSSHESLLLLQAFTGVLAILSLILAAATSDRRRLEGRLVYLADHDSLTDLLSRRRFQADLGRHLAEARRYGTHGSLLFLDLDDFKDVNDTLGHAAGDELLAALAGLLRRRLRDSDLVARLGGDEFAVLLPHTGGDQARGLAGHLIEAIRSHPFTAGGRRVTITASIGIALYPDHADTVDELLSHADSAMYEAKALGRHQVRMHSPRPDAARADRTA